MAKSAPRDKSPAAKKNDTRHPDARTALLDAGIALLAECGPDGVSSREVARRAGVNYGLVHYYFDTKDELIHQAVEREIARYAQRNPALDSGEWRSLLIDDPPPETTWRSILHLALDWHTNREVFDGIPIWRTRLQRLRDEYGDDVDDVRLRAAFVASTCLNMGWLAMRGQQLAVVNATAAEAKAIRDFVKEVDQAILALAVGTRAAKPKTHVKKARKQPRGDTPNPST